MKIGIFLFTYWIKKGKLYSANIGVPPCLRIQGSHLSENFETPIFPDIFKEGLLSFQKKDWIIQGSKLQKFQHLEVKKGHLKTGEIGEIGASPIIEFEKIGA